MREQTLDNEFFENPVKLGAGVRAAVHALGQDGDKVGDRFRHQLAEKTDFDSSHLAAGYFHVQVRFVGDRKRLLRGLYTNGKRAIDISRNDKSFSSNCDKNRRTKRQILNITPCWRYKCVGHPGLLALTVYFPVVFNDH